MPTELLFCPHCGGRNERDAKFCGFCGRDMDDMSPGPAVPATPSQAPPARRSRLPLLLGLGGVAVIGLLAIAAFSAPVYRWIGAAAHRAPAGPAAMQPAGPGNFDVVLDAAGEQKIRVIKTVRELTGLSLAQSKTLVESAPVTIKTKISQQDAERIKQRLQGLDAAVRVVPAGTVARGAPAPAAPVPPTASPALPVPPVLPAAPPAAAPSATPPAPPLGSPAPRAQLAVDNFALSSITPRTGTDGLHVDLRGSFKLSGSTAPVSGQIVPAWRKGAGAMQYGTPAPFVARSGAVPVTGSVFVPRPLPSDSVQVFLAVRLGGREWISAPGSIALAAQPAAPVAPPATVSRPPATPPSAPPPAATPTPASPGTVSRTPIPAEGSATPPPAPSAPPGAAPRTEAAAVRLKLTPTSPTQVAAGAKVSFDLSYVSALVQRVSAECTLAWRTPDGTLHYGTNRTVTASPGTNAVRGLGLTIGTSSSGTTLPVYGVVRLDGTVYRTQMPVLVNVAPATRTAPASSTPPPAGIPPSQLSTVSRLRLLPNGPTVVPPGTVIPLTFSFDLVNLDAADVEAALAWRVETGPLNYGQYTTLHAKRGPNDVKGTFTAGNMPSGTVISVHVVVRYAGATYTSNPVPVTIK